MFTVSITHYARCHQSDGIRTDDFSDTQVNKYKTEAGWRRKYNSVALNPHQAALVVVRDANDLVIEHFLRTLDEAK